MGNWLSQVGALTMLNLRTISQRRGSALSAMVGIAGVVAVFVTVLSIAEGLRATMAATGSPDTVLVMRGGSDSEMMSGLGRDATRLIADAPGVRRAAAGPVSSAELFVVVDLPKKSTGTDANVPLRGVQETSFAVRQRFKIEDGRTFEPGTSEIIVGRGAAAEFSGLAIGQKQRWGQTDWTVVGIFSDGGSLSESEIWCDVGVLQPAYRRGSTFQSVHARLESPADFTRFRDALKGNPQLDVKVQRESDYYAGQSSGMSRMIRILGSVIALLMAGGAVFGALNTMYSTVAARSREIATLRALGFKGSPVILSVMAESMFLALVGGLVGAGIAYFAFNGYRTSTLNWQSFSQVAFAFKVTPLLLVLGTGIALVIGLIGGLFPAWRAAHLPVATALREL